MKRIADYELLAELGPGNHGTFFQARPPARLGPDQGLVAVKVLDRHATDNELKRMGAELETLLSLRHPHLVRVLDAGHDQGRLYYVTPWFPEASLATRPYGPDRVVEAATQVADAAEAAHALHQIGVVHRDIKPANIMVADGRGQLSDLGVANYAAAQFTTTGSSPVGTLTYADPDLIRGEPAGRASDVWSLGATLHRAVTGHSVIGTVPDTHLAAALEYVLDAEVRLDPACPPGVAAVVARATQPHRADRYLTALELADDLRAVLGQEPSTVEPAGQAGQPLALAPPRRASPAAAPHDQPVLVIGARSGGGHLNHPEARRCRLSGEDRPTAPEPWLLVRGPRPPLGTLVGDDGRAHLVRADLVVGRQPELDPAVSGGLAGAVPYRSDPTMSRTHLRFQLRDWQVTVTDVSTNGSTLRRAGGAEPQPLDPGTPTLLTGGDVVAFEGRTLTYHDHVSHR